MQGLGRPAPGVSPLPLEIAPPAHHHVVLTRAAYAPELWPLADNRARLQITSRVTVPLMAAQTTRDWRWRILLHPDDELLEERMAVFRQGGICEFLRWDDIPAEPRTAAWDTRPEMAKPRDLLAAEAYRVPWRAPWELDASLLQTRLDDDDGFAVDALERYQRAAAKLTSRAALMFPNGYRVWGGRMDVLNHQANAMASLFTPAGDSLCIYDYGHTQVRRAVPVVTVDRRPAWFWFRHSYTLSGWRRARTKITAHVRRIFPIDWDFVGAHL